MEDQGLLVEGRLLRLAIELMTMKSGGYLTPKTPQDPPPPPVSVPGIIRGVCILYVWQ